MELIKRKVRRLIVNWLRYLTLGINGGKALFGKRVLVLFALERECRERLRILMQIIGKFQFWIWGEKSWKSWSVLKLKFSMILYLFVILLLLNSGSLLFCEIGSMDINRIYGLTILSNKTEKCYLINNDLVSLYFDHTPLKTLESQLFPCFTLKLTISDLQTTRFLDLLIRTIFIQFPG